MTSLSWLSDVVMENFAKNVDVGCEEDALVLSGQVIESLDAVLWGRGSVMDLRDVWAEVLPAMRALKEYPGLYTSLIARKDYYRDIINGGRADEYLRARLSCISKQSYLRVWKDLVQVSFEEARKDNFSAAVYDVIFNYESQERVFAAMASRYVIDLAEGGFCVMDLRQGGVSVAVRNVSSLEEAKMLVEGHARDGGLNSVPFTT